MLWRVKDLSLRAHLVNEIEHGIPGSDEGYRMNDVVRPSAETR
jgi:hypothetical protein